MKAIRIIHLNRVPELSEKLGILATIQVANGSAKDLSTGEFADMGGSSRWRMTSVALGVPADSRTLGVAFKKVTGNGNLSVGMELRQVGGKAS